MSFSQKRETLLTNKSLNLTNLLNNDSKAVKAVDDYDDETQKETTTIDGEGEE